MSILGFLRVIEQSLHPTAKPPDRRRRLLALETLEGRAVFAIGDVALTLPPLEVAPLPPVTPTSPLPPPISQPPVMPPPVLPPPIYPPPVYPPPVYPPPSDPPPVYPPPSDPPPSDPPAEDPSPTEEPPPTEDPPSEYHPPTVTSFSSGGSNGAYYFHGTVTDDESMVGQPVFILSIYGTFETVVDADGEFYTQTFFWPTGTLVSAWTIDRDGNYSEVSSLTI